MKTKSLNKVSIVWFLVLAVVGILTRWLPHPPNFTALLAIALYAGFVLPPAAALAVPVLAALIGDAWLGYHDGLWVVYLSLLPLVFIGRALPEAKSTRSVLGWGLAGLTGAVFFYLTTNLAVWWSSGMYPHNVEGLVSCFVLAIPFFHNSVVSTWIFMGAFEATRQLVPQLRTSAALA